MMRLCGEQPASEEKAFARAGRGSNWRGKRTTITHRAPQEKGFNTEEETPPGTLMMLSSIFAKKKKDHFTQVGCEVKNI